ncbi:MAG TPA: nucleotidyltransferase domain-containing protein [Azospirillaceae bacterium]|nr:nucleotidyltransferase domain-containing protein [Azospirillaceae bacterium]
MLTLDDVLSRLRSHAAELRSRGVAHAAVFGSLARGEAGPDSDVDVLVTLAPDARLGLIGYAALGRRLGEIVGGPVDMVNRRALRPRLRPEIEREAVDAF